MITILVTLLVIAVIAYVVYLILEMLPLPAPLKTNLCFNSRSSSVKYVWYLSYQCWHGRNIKVNL